MAEGQKKKRGRPKKAAPSSSPSAKTVKRRNGTVTFGKNATIGKGVQ